MTKLSDMLFDTARGINATYAEGMKQGGALLEKRIENLEDVNRQLKATIEQLQKENKELEDRCQKMSS